MKCVCWMRGQGYGATHRPHLISTLSILLDCSKVLQSCRHHHHNSEFLHALGDAGISLHEERVQLQNTIHSMIFGSSAVDHPFPAPINKLNKARVLLFVLKLNKPIHGLTFTRVYQHLHNTTFSTSSWGKQIYSRNLTPGQSVRFSTGCTSIILRAFMASGKLQHVLYDPKQPPYFRWLFRIVQYMLKFASIHKGT